MRDAITLLLLVSYSLIVALWAVLRVSRRARVTAPQCAACGYQVTALTLPRCPECGAALERYESVVRPRQSVPLGLFPRSIIWTTIIVVAALILNGPFSEQISRILNNVLPARTHVQDYYGMSNSGSAPPQPMPPYQSFPGIVLRRTGATSASTADLIVLHAGDVLSGDDFGPNVLLVDSKSWTCVFFRGRVTSAQLAGEPFDPTTAKAFDDAAVGDWARRAGFTSDPRFAREITTAVNALAMNSPLPTSRWPVIHYGSWKWDERALSAGGAVIGFLFTFWIAGTMAIAARHGSFGWRRVRRTGHEHPVTASPGAGGVH